MKKIILICMAFIFGILIYELNKCTITRNSFDIIIDCQDNWNDIGIKAFLDGTFQQYGYLYEEETSPFWLLLVLEGMGKKEILLEQIDYIFDNDQKYAYKLDDKINILDGENSINIKNIPFNFNLYQEFEIILYFKDTNNDLETLTLRVRNNKVTETGLKIFFEMWSI